MTESASADRIADRTGETLAKVGASRGWLVAFGLLTLIAGILVLLWPGQSILVLAVVLGIWLLVAGIFRLVTAIAVDDVQGGTRVLIAALGVLAILVGVLCLARPFQTATGLALLLGAFWVIGGVIETFHGIAGHPPGRAMVIIGGVVSVIAGIVVLAYPGASLVVLTWLFGIALIVFGVIFVGGGLAGAGGTTRAPQRIPPTAGPVTP
jgi:uncharacterized membrane protein HdeD (DUF308 family)